MATKIYVEAAGCKRRMLDIRTIKNYLEVNGHTLVDAPEDADQIVVTTCAFKQKEEDESVNRLRFFRKFGRKILVYGCLPDIAAERFREFSDFHSIAPREIEQIDRYFEHDVVKFSEMSDSNLIEKKEGNLVKAIKRKVQSGDLFSRDFFAETAQSGVNRLRELLTKPEESWFLFICRGCRGKCSYCAIQRSVGSVKSKPIPQVVRELREGLRAGYRDFSILGDDPGCYGLDNQESLPQLLHALLTALPTEGPVAAGSPSEIRFHIKEIHPKFMVEYGQQLVEQPFFRMVHSLLCPVQSGSDRILELMQREHNAAEIRGVLHHARHEHPQITLDTQIIVGFPSETEEDFQATLNLVRESGFNTVVVFPYHDKKGTPASEIATKVAPDLIQQRMRKAFNYFRKNGVKAYYSCP